jgi:hypothetical protein
LLAIIVYGVSDHRRSERRGLGDRVRRPPQLLEHGIDRLRALTLTPRAALLDVGPARMGQYQGTRTVSHTYSRGETGSLGQHWEVRTWLPGGRWG